MAGKASFETSLSWLNDTSTGQGTTATKVSSLQLNGNKETTPAHPSLGARFVPNNNGFALVQSQTADVFALRLAHTGVLVAYQMKPNPDIPKDWNVITFPIDPHYTKQGMLDGKVGGDVDVDYPNALNYSPDISYFKPIEAYGLKTQIQQQEQQLATLYAQYDVDPNQLSGGQLPDMAAPLKLDLVNTYVWTADGGQFAETINAGQLQRDRRRRLPLPRARRRQRQRRRLHLRRGAQLRTIRHVRRPPRPVGHEDDGLAEII